MNFKQQAVLAAAAASGLMAQNVMYFQQRSPNAPERAYRVEMSTATAGFVAGNFVSGNAVKGAPYSAESVVEDVRTLADGNRIVTKQTTKVYRDSEGRERREMTFGEGANATQQIMISDPVAGVNYTLVPEKKIAMKMPVPQLVPAPPAPPAPPAVPASPASPAAPAAPSSVASPATPAIPAIPAAPLAPEASIAGVATARIASRSPGSQVILLRNNFSLSSLDENVVSEDLGTRTIEGVIAEGHRIKSTIPAGQIGNERPIETMTETWYSPELKTMVLTTTKDPRIGENTMKLTGINRSEPSALLFEVPPDYKVQDPTTTVIRGLQRE